MDENLKLEINNSDLEPPKQKKSKEKKGGLKIESKSSRSWIVFLCVGIIGISGGIFCLLFSFFRPIEEPEPLVFPTLPSASSQETEIYSPLTGRVIASEEERTAPTYCIQVPNGLDGARPQVGLTEAGVVFEAIAEAGITRFAAIFQNPSQAVIGPIRSLRIYYLNWDTPFDCTIVHAGGSDDAIAAVRAGKYKDLTENYTYMYRGTNSARRWNNLFTTSADLARFSADRGYGKSDVKGFLRMTPSEAEINRVDELVSEKLDILKATENNTSELVAKVGGINLRFGSVASYNVHYDYDLATNTYMRSYSNGAAHDVYKCPDENLGRVNPEKSCSLTRLAPSVVVAMIVQEKKAWDNYHENITTNGSGEAFIFQNGTVVRGSWNKSGAGEQIRFLDAEGTEIKLVPGQAFVSAIPAYGGVDF